MGSLLRVAILGWLAALLLAGGSLAVAQPTPIPQRFCGTIRVQGHPWGVDGTGPRCRAMRHWTRLYLRDGSKPRGWSCVGRGADGGTCTKRHSSSFFEFYAED